MVATGTQSPLLVFSYNVCNLPREVTSSASGSLTYTYLSDGTKVSAIKSDGSGERYIGSFVYTVPSSGSETLESAAWDEGRISFTKSGSTYTKTDLWFVKDHVGNVRTVVDITPGLSAPQVVERNDYLPFGTRMGAGTAVLATNRYRLGGKESQTFGSLDLGKVDFGARMYDPFTARWTTADPLAAKYGSMSPYNYCGGNPANIVDPMGRDVWEVNEQGAIQWKEESKNHVLYFINGAGEREDQIFLDDRTALDVFADNNSGLVHFSSDKNVDDLKKLFIFLSDHTSIEWALHISEAHYTLGTAHKNDAAGSWRLFGLNTRPDISYHSHPDVNPSLTDEVDSMGFDYYHMKNAPEEKAKNYYIYFPESRNVYLLTPKNYKKINNPIAKMLKIK